MGLERPHLTAATPSLHHVAAHGRRHPPTLSDARKSPLLLLRRSRESVAVGRTDSDTRLGAANAPISPPTLAKIRPDAEKLAAAARGERREEKKEGGGRGEKGRRGKREEEALRRRTEALEQNVGPGVGGHVTVSRRRRGLQTGRKRRRGLRTDTSEPRLRYGAVRPFRRRANAKRRAVPGTRR